MLKYALAQKLKLHQKCYDMLFILKVKGGKCWTGMGYRVICVI